MGTAPAVASSRTVERNLMYIGVGAVVLILAIVLLVMLLRGRSTI